MILALLQWLLLLLLLSLLVRIVRRRRHHPPLLIHLLLLLHHRLPRGRWVHNIHMTTAAATTGSRPTLPLRLLTVRIVRISRCRSLLLLLLLLHRRTAHHGAIGIIRSRNSTSTSTCDNIVGRSTTAIATRIRTTANVVGRGICIHSTVASSRSTITTGIAVCIRIRIRIARIRIQQAPATSTTPCIGTTGSTGMAGIIIGGHWPPTTAAGEVWVDRPSRSGSATSSPNH